MQTQLALNHPARCLPSNPLMQLGNAQVRLSRARLEKRFREVETPEDAVAGFTRVCGALEEDLFLRLPRGGAVC